MRLISSLLTAHFLSLAILAASTGSVVAQTPPGLGGSSGLGGDETEEPAEDPLQLLLGILEDDAARTRLVEQLQEATSEEAGSTEPTEEERPRSIGRVIGDFTQSVGTRLRTAYTEFRELAQSVPTLLSGLSSEEIDVVVDALRVLLLTIAATVVTFLTLRASAIPVYRSIGGRAKGRRFSGRVLPFLWAGLMDFAIVFVAGAIGYVVAIQFFGVRGDLDLTQALYLFAFMVVELVKAALRLLLSPATAELRPLNLTDWAARRLYRVLRNVVSLLGYGYLVVFPIIHRDAGFTEARSTAAMLWLIVIAYLFVMILHYRKPVGRWLYAQISDTPTIEGNDEGSESGGDGEASGNGGTYQFTTLKPIAMGWYWLGLAWLLWLLFVLLRGRQGAFIELLNASGRAMLAIFGALVISAALGTLSKHGIPIPQSVSDRVPLLEKRLNSHVPVALSVVRLLIAAFVVLYAFETLNILNMREWPLIDFALQFTGAILRVAVILLLTFLVWLAMTSWVDYRLNPSYGDAPTAREQTLLTLLRNAATIAILALALMFALSEIGVNIGPLLASAGVVGLAIGFGAQKMVQDIITGIFIQFENAINVGDVVSAGGITGSAERLTVRSVSLRDLSGVYHIIPFSSVDTVSNYTRDFSFYLIDMGVGYGERVPEVKQAMHDAFEDLRNDPQHGAFILGDLEWFGLDAFGDNAVVLRCRIKTWPGRQWGVGRAYNEIVKRVFDERGIEIPFPQRTVWYGQVEDGKVSRLEDEDKQSVETSPDFGDTSEHGFTDQTSDDR